MADTKPFVSKLYTMVDDPSTAHIIGWTADGGAFQILQLEPFTRTQLPTYFKHGNLSSFVRQLNTYGFSKIDANSWVFSHPDFVRGDAERLARIQRKSSHRPAAASSSDADVELPMPDGMDQLVPLSGGHGAAAASTSAAATVPAAASAAEVAAMRRRIELLNQEVSQARAQQADTRASIGKIMEFLSQMYREQRRANAHGVGASGVVGQFPPLLPAPPPPRPSSAEGGVVVEQAPTAKEEEEQRSKRQRTTGAESVKLEPQSITHAREEEAVSANAAAAAGGGGAPLVPPFVHLQPPSLSRQSSLGAQVASALPIDLRELALELAGSTELQDRTLHDIRSNANRGGGGGGGGATQEEGMSSGGGLMMNEEENGGVPDDVDAYLWDFIETSQELAAEADSSNKAKGTG